jgi:chemotaxis protein MotB
MSDGGHGGGGKRRGHEEEHEEHENHERWLVSYADMMTLLMVLFIVMFAISQVDSRKFMALKAGLEAGFGAPVSFVDGADALLETGTKIGKDQENLAGVAGQVNADPEKQQARQAANAAVNPEKVAELVNALAKASVKAEVDSLKKAEAQLQKALQVAGIAKGATFRFDERGLVVSIATDKVLFDSGSATLRPTGKKIIDALAPTLRKLPNQMSIDGHTDSHPISSAQFPSNWELGAARAAAVQRYLATAHRVPYSHMNHITSFADTAPAAPGNSAAAMAADRRVEIVVLARLDNTAGRAVSQLGNTTATGTTGTNGSSDAGTVPDPAAAGTATPTETPTETPLPTPKHNLLGPDPTPAAAHSAARTAAEHRG